MNQLTKTKTSLPEITSSEIIQTVASGDFSKVMLLERDLTPAIAFGKPQLSKIRSENPEGFYKTLEALLFKLSLSLNIGKNLESWQIAEIAQDLAKKYYFFSLEEFILVLQRGRMGEFGKIYDRLDGSVLMEWFQKYDTSDERLALVQNRRVKQMRQDLQDNQQSMIKLYDHPLMQQQILQMRETTKIPEEQDEEGYRQFKNQYIKQQLSTNNEQQTMNNEQ